METKILWKEEQHAQVNKFVGWLPKHAALQIKKHGSIIIFIGLRDKHTILQNKAFKNTEMNSPKVRQHFLLKSKCNGIGDYSKQSLAWY